MDVCNYYPKLDGTNYAKKDTKVDDIRTSLALSVENKIIQCWMILALSAKKNKTTSKLG